MPGCLFNFLSRVWLSSRASTNVSRANWTAPVSLARSAPSIFGASWLKAFLGMITTPTRAQSSHRFQKFAPGSGARAASWIASSAHSSSSRGHSFVCVAALSICAWLSLSPLARFASSRRDFVAVARLCKLCFAGLVFQFCCELARAGLVCAKLRLSADLRSFAVVGSIHSACV